MTGFELRISGVGSDRATNCAINTDQFLLAVTWSTAAYRTLRLVSAQVVSYCVYELTKQ